MMRESEGHRLSWEDRNRQSRDLLRFLRSGPYEPMASRDEVLKIPCGSCGAEAGASCDTAFPRPTMIWGIFRGFGDIHLRRYLDRTHDPR